MQAIHDGDWELYRHFRRYLLIAIAWAAVNLVVAYLIFNVIPIGETGAVSGMGPGGSAAMLILVLVAWALWLCPMLSVARACFRSTIAGELPSVAAAFRFDAPFWRFARTNFLIVLLATAVHSIGSFKSADTDSLSVAFGGVFGWLGPLLVVAVFGSVALALPVSAATGLPKPIKAALVLSRGQRLRLCVISLLAPSPILLVQPGVLWVWENLCDGLPNTHLISWSTWSIYLLANYTLMYLCVVALAGAISSAYLQLTGARADRDIASVFD